MTWRRPAFATIVALLFGCVIAAGHPSAASGQTPAGGASVMASHRATLDEYCVGCHNERLTSGEMRLDTLDVADVAAVAESWERVIVKLRSESMPPPGRPRPGWPNSEEARVCDRRVCTWTTHNLLHSVFEEP